MVTVKKWFFPGLLIPDCWACRFDGVALLQTWSGKTVMFVGDSLALNQYESLLCMLHAAAPDARTTVSPASGKINPSTTVRFEVTSYITCFHAAGLARCSHLRMAVCRTTT
jgi:hypothetical protein